MLHGVRQQLDGHSSAHLAMGDDSRYDTRLSHPPFLLIRPNLSASGVVMMWIECTTEEDAKGKEDGNGGIHTSTFPWEWLQTNTYDPPKKPKPQSDK